MVLTAHTIDMENFLPPDIETPCVKICVIEPESGYCIGCGRTGLEIAHWIGYSPDMRRGVMASLPERVATLTSRKSRRGGRRGRLGGT